MSRSLAMSGKAIATKSSKEKWLSIVQSVREKGENGMGTSSTVTLLRHPGWDGEELYNEEDIVGGLVVGKAARELKVHTTQPYKLFRCLYCFRTIWGCHRFFSGSQVFSTEEYPFQDTRYNCQLGDPLCERILAISYSSSLSISSGGGFMKFGMCSAVSQ